MILEIAMRFQHTSNLLFWWISGACESEKGLCKEKHMLRVICLVVTAIVAYMSSGHAWADISYSQAEKEALISLMAQVRHQRTEIEAGKTANSDRPWENTFFGSMVKFSDDGPVRRVTGLVMEVDRSVSSVQFPQFDELKILTIIGHEGLVEIKGLEKLSSLQVLKMRATAIDALGEYDLPYKTLAHLTLEQFTHLESIQLTQAAALETITMQGVPKLEKLNLSQYPQLKMLSIIDSSLTQISVENLSALEEIDLEHNALLKAMQVKSCPNLSGVSIKNSPLETLELSSLPALSRLQVRGTKLRELDLSQVPRPDVFLGNNPQLSKIRPGKKQ